MMQIGATNTKTNFCLPKDLNDKWQSHKSTTHLHVRTPNTDCNSSHSGSTKVIGLRSKLNTKSQVYKVNTSRSSANRGNSSQNTYPTTRGGQHPHSGGLQTMRSSDMFSNRQVSNQHIYEGKGQFPQNKFGAVNPSFP